MVGETYPERANPFVTYFSTLRLPDATLKLRRYIKDAIRRLVPTGDVADQAAKSAVWSTVLNIGGRAVSITKLIILTWFLAPQAFGRVGLAILTIQIVKTIIDISEAAPLIQWSDDIEPYLDVVFTTRIVKNILIAVVAFLIAPFAASFFDEPVVSPLIRFLSITPIIYGLRNPGVVYFRKDLEYHRKFLYQLSRDVVVAVVAIGSAVVFRNEWAIAVGYCAGKINTFVISYLLHDYRPSLSVDLDKFKKLLDFGKWVTVSSVLALALTKGDDLFIGWFLGSSALGIYTVAYRFSNAPATELTDVIADVMFPAFSQIQDDITRVHDAYLTTLQLVSTVAFPMSFGIITVAPVFVPAFLGSSWMSAIPLMQLLAIWGLLEAIERTVKPILYAIGNPHYRTTIQVLKLVSIALGMYPLTAKYGVAGTAVALIISSVFVSLPLHLYALSKSINLNLLSVARLVLPPMAISALMAIGVTSVSSLSHVIPEKVRFVVLILVGIVVYGLPLIIIDIKLKLGYVELILNLKRRIA